MYAVIRIQTSLFIVLKYAIRRETYLTDSLNNLKRTYPSCDVRVIARGLSHERATDLVRSMECLLKGR